MRITPPVSLKVTRAQLLEEVRERLAERAPEFLEHLDATHPAWILLQEAAWMVESMTAQLDEFPYAVVRQFVHLLGAHLRPAMPSVCAVVVAPSRRGRLDLAGDPARWRMFTPQSETHGLVEFAIAETDIVVNPGAVVGLTRLVDGELHRASEAGEAQHAWCASPFRSEAFTDESARYSVLASDAERIEELLVAACKDLVERRKLGWLRLRVEREGDQVHVHAHIDPTAAIAESVSGLTQGGDVVGQWGELEDSTWTPPVWVADHPLLPFSLRLTRPLPGTEEGEILIPDVPANVPADQILVREMRPAPSEVITAIWKALARTDARLQPLRPSVERTVEEIEGEPVWVAGALRQRAWARIADHPDQTLAHVDLVRTERTPWPARVGWILERGELPRLRAFALHPEHGMLTEALPLEVAWHLPLPAPEGGNMVQVVALDVQVPAGATGLLLTADGEARGALLNPLLVVNAPAVRDGRQLTIQRAIPEPVNLVYQDVVDPGVVRMLVDQGIPALAAQRLSTLPLASFRVDGDLAILDYDGVQRDASEGLVVFNAPDDSGRTRDLRRGDVVRIDWYRRTDAGVGNVPAGAIQLVEQAPSTRPRLVSVTNPLAASWGSARESEDAAVQRIFGPRVSVPVTATDWERLVRQGLGSRAEGWLVRCWGHAERALVDHALWPPPSIAPDEDVVQLDAELSSAGPEVLLVALGTEDGVLEDQDLDWARQVIGGIVHTWRRRLPVLDRAIVTRLWPLQLRTAAAVDLPLPCYSPLDLQGTLVDPLGRSAEPPRSTLLLNGAVVSVKVR